MNIGNATFLLRLAVAVTLIAHSVPVIITGEVKNFGDYLNISGFAPLGFFLAWGIKISHLLSAVCLLVERYIRAACLVTIAVLIGGIVMVHRHDGWFVIGNGRNGVEFNVLLIFVLLTILFPRGLKHSWDKR